MGGNPNFPIQVVLGGHVHGVTILWLSSFGLESLKFGPLYQLRVREYFLLACGQLVSTPNISYVILVLRNTKGSQIEMELDKILDQRVYFRTLRY